MTSSTDKIQTSSDLNQLIVAQLDYHEQVTKIWTNFKKLSLTKRTRAAIRNRLDTLDSFWKALLNRHDQILVHSTGEQRQLLDYFTKDTFSSILANVAEVRDSLCEVLEAQTANSNAADHDTSSSSAAQQTSKPFIVNLPPINLPKFTGELIAWPGFRDLFTSLVVSRDDLTNVQKLHYLKASLEGKAIQILRSTEITEANFKTAWELLQKRYDNPRAIVYAHLDRFLALPKVGTAQERDLRILRDQAHEIYHALLGLKRPVDLWEDQFVHYILTKLDSQTRREWELTQKDVCSFPTFEELDEYLSFRLRALETAGAASCGEASAPVTNKEPRRSCVKTHQATSNKLRCFVCQGDHPLFQCQAFTSKPIAKRIELINSQDRCLNCFRRGHRVKNCNNGNVCRICKMKHHTLVHIDQTRSSSINASTSKTMTQTVQSDTTSSTGSKENREISNNCADVCKNYTLLPTATVLLRSAEGRTLRVRALLDQGSQATFIAESAVQLLRPARLATTVRVSGIGSCKVGAIRHAAVLTIQSCDSKQAVRNVTALILPKLSSYLPPPTSLSLQCPQLGSLQLADHDPFNKEPVQLIIGADYYGSFLREGLIRGPGGSPVAQLTIFGWILSGQVPQSNSVTTRVSVNHVAADEELLASLSKFWELEELPKTSFPTEEELRCEEHFKRTHSRSPDGRYTVSLPFKSSDPIAFGDSKTGAHKLYNQLENRLFRNPDLAKDYHLFLREYLNIHHMERVPFEVENVKTAFYLPHHPVVKASSSTTKVRVVFNASFRADDNKSLNDALAIGPKLQADLFSLVLSWRAHRYVYTTDVEKMFRQILVDSKDIDVQRILWRPSQHETIQSFRLLTVTYGTACAPFLANRVIKQLAADEGGNYPLAQKILETRVYVDDIMFGADDCESLQEIQKQVTQLLRAGGFRPYKWSANNPLLLAEIPEEDWAMSPEKILSPEAQVTVLGIHWEPLEDVFRFQVTELPPVKTKRAFLSLLARIFDPHGWAAPVTINAKILLQGFWRLRLDWDDTLPAALAESCLRFQMDLPLLNQLSIPRWTGQSGDSQNLQVHGFCDASNAAYAAVVYLRLEKPSSDIQTVLLFSKTKVAPVKLQTIPRLELCAAHLLVRAVKFVVSQLQCNSITCWTDSSVVLAWLQSPPSRWKLFVANRVSVIQNELPQATWRHVPTAHNPADCASRGIPAPQLLTHPLWWHGPSWLCREQTEWPNVAVVPENNSVISEQQSLRTLHTRCEPVLELADKVSSWTRLLRITAYIFRFINNVRATRSRITCEWITFAEIKASTTFWIRHVQNLHFQEASTKLKNSLRKLDVYTDENGILRVGGRLRNSNLASGEKFPVLIPPCRLATLLALHAHFVTLHGGLQVTLRYLREKYWIIRARSLVKQVGFNCVVCTRHRAVLANQRMGDLPAARVTPSRPFTHTGIDYAGPFLIRSSKGRGIKTHKAYCVIFVCLAVRAIHLECADDATTSGFLAAFDRFTSRRGLPAIVYSDNGTNFVGAARALTENYNKVMSDATIMSRYAADGIDWRFNPPAAPHFGGLWEAGVKSVKYHLRRVIGEFTPTYEEFSTLLCQIEGILNSRPIAPLHDDIGSLEALTPGHFLTGSYLRTVPVPGVLSEADNRLSRWQTVQKLQESFWKIWSSDYLNSLQQRQKWQKTQVNFQVDDLVLLKSNNLPPSKWEMGRITRCFHGQDGLVRVVLVRTATSEYKRPVTQLCRLPVDSHTAKNPTPS